MTALAIAANNYDSDNNCARHSRKSHYLHKVEIYYDDVMVVLQKLKLSLMSRRSTALRGLRFDACPGGSGSRVNGCGFGGWVWGGVSRGRDACRHRVESRWFIVGIIGCNPSHLGQEGIHLA